MTFTAIKTPVSPLFAQKQSFHYRSKIALPVTLPTRDTEITVSKMPPFSGLVIPDSRNAICSALDSGNSHTNKSGTSWRRLVIKGNGDGQQYCRMKQIDFFTISRHGIDARTLSVLLVSGRRCSHRQRCYVD